MDFASQDSAAERATIDHLDPPALRELLGRFCSGVTVVATEGPAGVDGFACQSFSALSLDPPMVLISVMRQSRTLPVLLDRGDFAVSVLGADAAEVSATVGGRDPDKFSRVPLDRTGRGLPVVSGSLAWFDCSVARVVDGGDHVVILADVHGAGPADRDGDPLLFFRGRYEQIARPAPTVTPEITRPVTPSAAPDLAAVGSARHRELAGALTGYTPGDWF